MDMQKLIELMSDSFKLERMENMMLLGELIKELEYLDPKLDLVVDVGGSIDEPHSYRGYYCDLSFNPSNDTKTVGEVLSLAKDALGKSYTGYKGGEYTMDKRTPIWYSNYGECGREIVGVSVTGGKAVIQTQEDES